MARLEFSHAELDAITATLGLSLWRFPFAAPRFGGHGRESRYAAVKSVLESRGLIDGPRFAPELENTLTTFAKGQVTVAVNGMTDRRALTALAVVHGNRAVFAVEQDSRLTFQTMPADRAVRAAVNTLPAVRPGSGRSITITASATPEAHSFVRAVRPAVDHGARAAQLLLTRPRLGGGGFLVSGPADARETVSWLDTDTGRYAVTRTTAPDGTTHVTFTPADQARLEQLITRALANVT